MFIETHDMLVNVEHLSTIQLKIEKFADSKIIGYFSDDHTVVLYAGTERQCNNNYLKLIRGITEQTKIIFMDED